MRPRVFPAEDDRPDRPDAVVAEVAASMRPRVFPAEDGDVQIAADPTAAGFNEAAGIPRGRLLRAKRSTRTFPPGFNEAAGIPRGRRGRVADSDRPALASMRPRVFPAEDDGAFQRPARGRTGFNEAAGIPRGRRHQRWAALTRSFCFNEAAGIPRGRPGGVVRLANGTHPCFNEAAGIPRGRRTASISRIALASGASMRPRVFPAEDRAITPADVSPGCASMRPRVFPAEDPALAQCLVEYFAGFNEAAGIPRGRRRIGRRGRYRVRRFNEAAGIPRGRHRARPGASTAAARGASMRPRVFPAEDDLIAAIGVVVDVLQ